MALHTVKVQTYLRYIDEFVRLSSAPMMLELGLFPNAKEISETMAIWEAYRKFLSKDCADFTDEDAFIAVGDGATPRTAALFAFLSKGGTCFAIDPLLEQGAATHYKKSTAATYSSSFSKQTASNAVTKVQQQSDHNAQFFRKLADASPSVAGANNQSAAKKSGELDSHP